MEYIKTLLKPILENKNVYMFIYIFEYLRFALLLHFFMVLLFNLYFLMYEKYDHMNFLLSCKSI
jgi:hypothetical protein